MKSSWVFFLIFLINLFFPPAPFCSARNFLLSAKALASTAVLEEHSQAGCPVPAMLLQLSWLLEGQLKMCTNHSELALKKW